jgi:hypothetical protein
MLLGMETAARRSCDVKPYVSVFGNVCVQRYTSSTSAIDFFQTTKSRYDWTMGLTEHCIYVGCPVGTLAECDVRHSGLWISRGGSGEWPVLKAAFGSLSVFLGRGGRNQGGKSGIGRGILSWFSLVVISGRLDFRVKWEAAEVLTRLILANATGFTPELKGGAVPFDFAQGRL